jgi:predicted ATP-dependent endonuclease of OLD family
MHFKYFSIQNYRSLQSIEFKDLGNLIILIGKNSSGKTNILEALWLFSKDFSLIPETVTINSPLTANELMWFEGITDVPINFHAEIELDDSESKKVFPADFLKTFESNIGKTTVIVKRQIVATPPNMSWKTIELVCNDVRFIEDGKTITPKIMKPKKALKKRKAPSKKTAIEGEAKTTDLKEGDKEQTENLVILKSEDVQKIAKNLESVIREKIMWVQASRGKASTPSNYGVRTTTVDDATTSKIVAMGETLGTRVRRKWRRLQDDFENFSPYRQRLNVVKSQIVVDETNLSVPLYLVGGGTQEIVALIRHIEENGKPIVLIEEPESHLHPELAKSLFKYFRNLSKNRQIWLSTQSPFFLNRNEIDNTWSVSREDNETEILRLMDKVELKKTILEIGVKPSDWLFSDALLLVEGPTEEDVIPIWSRTIKIELEELGVSIIPIRGAEKGKYHLKMWREVTKGAQIPLFILLDAHAKKEAKELIDEHLINRDHCFVSDVSSIEETYPKNYVLKAIEDEWGIQITAKELADTKAETLKKAVEDKGMKLDGNWWKPVLGRRVAELMKANEIPEGTRRLIERIKLTLD